MVYDELVRYQSDGRYEDFCKFYILLGLFKFLFPNRIRNVYTGLFHIINDLCELSSFKWGAAVYTYMVKNLC